MAHNISGPEALRRLRAAGLLSDLDDTQLAAITAGDARDQLTQHWLSDASADDAVRAPCFVAHAAGIAALDGVLRDGGDHCVVIDPPSRPARTFLVRTYGQWVRLFDMALEAVGDPRRLVALEEDNDDIEEAVYVLATTEQAHVLHELGWTMEFPPSEEPIEQDAGERAAQVAGDLSRRLEGRGASIRAVGGEVVLTVTPQGLAWLRTRLRHERRAQALRAFRHRSRW